MPRNIDYFNYVLDPTNFIGKTFPSKNELKVFNKEIKWNKQETKLIKEAIKTYVFLMRASIIVWFVSALFSLGITLLAPLKISGILYDEDNKFDGMPMYVVIISLVSIPIFIILLFIFRVIIMHQVNKELNEIKNI